MIVAVTGHRPLKCGGFGQRATDRLRRFAIYAIGELHMQSPIERGISGMAIGFDQACALAFSFYGIPWTAAIPCLGQDSVWPEEARKEYRRVLRLADRIEQVSAGVYNPKSMLVRNCWMVDQLGKGNSDTLLALWDGSPTGGTKHCVEYAESTGRNVMNVWKKWTEFQEGERRAADSSQ